MDITRRGWAELAVLLALLVAVAWLLGSRNSTGVAVAADPPTGDRAREGVLVSGTGQVHGRPDVLAVNFGVETRGSTVDEALSRANTGLDRIRKVFSDGGVAETDMQTSELSIYPRHSDDGTRILGYQVSEQLTVKLRDLGRAGGLLGKAAEAGGNATRIHGLAFEIEDDSQLLAEARKQAFDDAKAKASLYAQAAGRGLGRVLSVTETVTGPSPIRERNYDPSYLERVTSTIPIEPGQQRLSVTVTVEWAFT